MTSNLNGKVAVVTGAARGLGLGIATRLAAGGATVYCADLSDSAESAASLPGSHRHGSAILDVTNAADAQALADRIVAEAGHLDVWVNNAGVVAAPGPAHLASEADVRRMIEVNLLGVLNCSRAAASAMLEAQRPGRIINISSGRARIAWSGLGIYGATKAAVIALTQAMALELAPGGVTVNAICPGTMWTEMAEGAFTQMSRDSGVPLEDLLAQKIGQIPAGRLGTPQDVGALAAFLASDESAFVTGAAINLTGGEDQF